VDPRTAIDIGVATTPNATDERRHKTYHACSGQFGYDSRNGGLLTAYGLHRSSDGVTTGHVFTGKQIMEFLAGHEGREAQIIDLFAATFTASEGEDEGALIGRLVRDLLSATPGQDLFVFTATEEETIVGGIVFSRLSYPQDDRIVFILAPVAVAPDRQRKGIGQRLLSHGLAALRSAGVDTAMTYGDPRYYARVGFMPISEVDARAPFPLQHPEGWLAQSLSDRPMAPLKGPSRCVEALNDPIFW
jgi:putative acetyltransferase